MKRMTLCAFVFVALAFSVTMSAYASPLTALPTFSAGQMERSYQDNRGVLPDEASNDNGEANAEESAAGAESTAGESAPFEAEAEDADDRAADEAAEKAAEDAAEKAAEQEAKEAETLADQNAPRIDDADALTAESDGVDLSWATIAAIPDQLYTGSDVMPAPRLTLRGKALEVGKDYALLYDNNVEAGTATVTATGMGTYVGSVSATFRIVRPSVSYAVHVQGIGDQSPRTDGASAGTSGESRRLESLRVEVEESPVSGGIEYQAHVQGIGWQGWVANGVEAGTRGQSRRLEAVRLRLTGDLAQSYDVWYRVHAQQVGWMGWAKDGEESGTAGMSWRLEALQVIIAPKGADAPATDLRGEMQATNRKMVEGLGVTYRTHVQGIGWQGWRGNGDQAGTSGQSRRLEALEVRLGPNAIPGSIRYNAHVQTYGWQGMRADGAMSGTEGESKRLEAIQLELTGELAQFFDVWYRTHVQTYGWMGWTKNGGKSGTQSLGKRMEAMEIRVVPKGSPAPGSTAGAFRRVYRRQLVFVGDSRMVGAYRATNAMPVSNDGFLDTTDGRGVTWVAQSGAAYNWFANTGVGLAENHVGPNTAIVIELGINDCVRFATQDHPIQGWSDPAHYASLINRKAREWARKGAEVYYATVTPIGYNMERGSYTYRYRTITNEDVVAWNAAMRSRLSPMVTVLDAYGAVFETYRSPDGLHHNAATYRRYYTFIRDSVA